MPTLGEKPPISTSKQIRRDAEAKACGAEKYAVDCYGENLLWAGVKRAGVPHAKLRAVSVKKALRLPGVVAALTAKDVPGPNRQGVVRADQPVLVDDKVRHCGDAVALVVAESKSALARALAAVTMDFAELPGVFDPEAALLPGAPILHEDHEGGNLLLEGKLVKGSGTAALKSCPVAVEAVWELPRQEHAYLETENGWALQDADGLIHLVVSTQTPHRDRLEVARAFDFKPDRIHLRAPYCGGAFGGKDGITVQSLLTLAAMACPGRPVKMWWDREESMIAGAKRHPARLYYQLGADKDGRLQALFARLIYDTGPYDHLGGVVATLGLEHAGGPYRIPNAELIAQAVYTNNPVGGPFRGFGVPQAAAGMELTMDLLAGKLGLDPLELRRRNLLKPGETSPAGVSLSGIEGLHECLGTVSRHKLWQGRRQWKKQAKPNKRRDVGLAMLYHAMGYGPVIPDEARARLALMDDGRFRLYSGVVDMGQGNASTFVQIAAEVLDQAPADFELIQPDTAETESCGSSSASRTTYTFGNAILGAAQTLRKRILSQAAKILGVDAVSDTLSMAPGLVRHAGLSLEISLAELAAAMPPGERDVTHYFRAPVATEPVAPNQNLALHGFPHAVYAYAVHLAAAEVDELTGKVDVLDYLTVSDVGAVINPQLLEQQMDGAVVQGLGYALCEDYRVHHGRSITRDFSTYLIPTSQDAPSIENIFQPSRDASSPLGIRGAGEIGIDGPLPAVGNAVARACGATMRSYPLTPERVLSALDREEGENDPR
jgi:CO/xanthine dehydrogenase Mo-binding subunit